MSKRPIGVLLAAGRGRRMKRLKQLLPWPTSESETTLVESSFDAIDMVCQQMVVVLGDDAAEIQRALAPRTFAVARSDSDAEMFESVKCGLLAAQKIDRSSAIMLHPADHPHVRATTLETLLKERKQHRSQAIVPTFNGRGGHPVLIPADLVRAILRSTSQDGLKGVWRANESSVYRTAVDDQHVIYDLDTPEDTDWPTHAQNR